MGNTPPSSSSSRRRRTSGAAQAAERAKKVVGDIQEELKKSVKKLDDDHPAAQLIDSVCGGYFDGREYRHSRSASFYSEESAEDGSRTLSEDDATYDDQSRTDSHKKGAGKDDTTVESGSYISQSDYESEPKSRSRGAEKSGDRDRRTTKGASTSFDTEEDSKVVAVEEPPPLLSKPLASSFAKRCYFTKAGIGKTTQHYEGLTLTGNIVLMLAAAMKLKGCPTICDEDLRRVEQTYPNQFSRLPDELLLSSGWRRISKYCHFSNKAIPDGVPFFHSKQRLHPTGGYYFLLAGAVGMVRPIDVEPLSRDTLVLLETDFPVQCDSVPDVLIREPEQWTLVNKFCFFSGGPINTEEDVYYQADFDGNPIYMLAFLSPSLTPEELYKLGDMNEPGLKSCAAVHEVESVYDLTERDFNDLKLYHLGPCRALPQYILQPHAWSKVLPPHFLTARQTAMLRAEDYEIQHGIQPSSNPASPQRGMFPPQGADFGGQDEYYSEPWHENPQSQHHHMPHHNNMTGAYENGTYHIPPSAHDLQNMSGSQDYYDSDPQMDQMSAEMQREVEEEGAFGVAAVPMDEAITPRNAVSPPGKRTDDGAAPGGPKLDPPEDEPPSLMKRDSDGFQPEEYENEEEEFPEEYYDEHSADDDDAPDPEDPIVSPEATPAGGDGRFFGGADPSYYMPPTHNIDDVADRDQGYDYSRRSRDPDDFPSRQPQYSTQMGGQFPSEDDEYDHEFAGQDGSFPTGYPTQGGQFPADGDEHVDDPSHTQFPPVDQYPPEDDEDDDGHQFDEARDNYPPTRDDHYYPNEEKKVALDEPSDPQLPYAVSHNGKPDGLAVDTTEDFIPIKREGYKLGVSPSPRSISGSQVSDGTPVSQSSALRGAQELLKKNRRRRMEMALKTRPRTVPPSDFDFGDDSATPQMDDASAGTWESGSEISASIVSGSSAWSEGSNPTDRSSRRKLILQMAKARMKSNKDGLSPTSGAGSTDVKAHAIQEEGGFSDGQGHEEVRKMMEAKRKPSIGGGSSVDANPADIDFSGDLD